MPPRRGLIWFGFGFYKDVTPTAFYEMARQTKMLDNLFSQSQLER
jgi:hypothetical protein